MLFMSEKLLHFFQIRYKEFVKYYYLIAWKPGVAQGRSSPTVNPRFVVNYNYSYFSYKSTPTQLRISKKSKKSQWLYRNPRLKIEANRSRGS